MLKNVRDRIEKRVKELGCEIGCYSDKLDTLLNKKALDIVIDNLDQEHTDLFITIRNNLYVVEISTVDNEKDIALYTGVAYFSKYGNLEDALDNEDITQEQYEKIKSVI